MKDIVIIPTHSKNEIAAQIANAEQVGYTHAQYELSGAKHVINLPAVSALVGTAITLTLGVRRPGLPFEDRARTPDEIAADAQPKPEKATTTTKEPAPKATKKAAKAKVATPAKPAKKAGKAKAKAKAKTPGSNNTGFVNLIDSLLRDTQEGKVEGFVRSKHSVLTALEAVLAKFPDKDPVSVKKIIKVRPRHLEKRKADEFNEKSKRAPRWAYVGPGSVSTATEIDALLSKGLTPAKIADQVSALHGKDRESCVALVNLRIKRAADLKAKEKAKVVAKKEASK